MKILRSGERAIYVYVHLDPCLILAKIKGLAMNMPSCSMTTMTTMTSSSQAIATRLFSP